MGTTGAIAGCGGIVVLLGMEGSGSSEGAEVTMTGAMLGACVNVGAGDRVGGIKGGKVSEGGGMGTTVDGKGSLST